jgi:Zn-dependent protease/predicted transcriptional regulator
MFGKGLRLFTVFGFEIKVDPSWLIIAVLVVWSLAVGFFPHYIEGLRPIDYWKLAVIGAFGLFFSILFHEFWHSWVARRLGVQVKGITLFVFGGVAEMQDEPGSPRGEFWIAVAGPLASLFLTLVFYLAFQVGLDMGLSQGVTSVFMYLALVNLILAIFNLIPAFPLDGGRILRAALWKMKKDYRWATRVATNFGSMFGLVLIGLGLLNMLTGNLVGGIWYILIGMFIRFAAKSSYQREVFKSALAGEMVRNLMKKPVTVRADLSLQELVDDYVYKYHHKMFPVMDGQQVQGCITTRQVGAVNRTNWSKIMVGEIMGRCSTENSVRPDDDVIQVLTRMNSTGQSRMMVVDKSDQLVGIVSLKDILGYLTARMELEGDQGLE